MKKIYRKPTIQIVVLHQVTHLLTQSEGGPTATFMSDPGIDDEE